ncbi:hypothetical protein BVC80_441g258 [Macleaya cordata]|uniref:Membrane-associated kinase regulator 1 n=1 Tax=Macleaya cordata TaxID=56857 RepID=A0A200Q4X5_MACCD|nr:hypothetical protein BVC80_441g258 [Macleaya cordata]
MGKSSSSSRKQKDAKSQTLPSSPSHSFSSSSSSDFEFTISLSPLKSSSNLCPADELFYKGQLLPLHLSPRLSMVRTLLLSPSRRTSSSSATDSTTTSRDSTGSSNSNDSHSSFASELVLLAAECDSSRPSSVTDLEDEIKRLNNLGNYHHHDHQNPQNQHQVKKPNKYFSLSRFSSVFRKDPTKNRDQENVTESSVKRMSSSAKDVIRKYLKKVKPLYEKLSQKQQQQQQKMEVKSKVISLSVKSSELISVKDTEISSVSNRAKENNGVFSHSFSGNLKYPRKRNCISSCPSSIRSSPNHSGVLCKSKVINGSSVRSVYDSESSSMNELQNAIQGAIAHCKNSMVQNKETLMVS